MATSKKVKQPDWKKWADDLFLPWYDRNKPGDIQLPTGRSRRSWNQWGEVVYLSWYELHKPGVTTADSNPGDPPPPPPGPIKP